MEIPTDADIKVINNQITTLTDTFKEFKAEQKETLSDIRESIRDLGNMYASKERVLSIENRVLGSEGRIKNLEDKAWQIVFAVLAAVISAGFTVYQYFVGRH